MLVLLPYASIRAFFPTNERLQTVDFLQVSGVSAASTCQQHVRRPKQDVGRKLLGDRGRVDAVAADVQQVVDAAFRKLRAKRPDAVADVLTAGKTIDGDVVIDFECFAEVGADDAVCH